MFPTVCGQVPCYAGFIPGLSLVPRKLPLFRKSLCTTGGRFPGCSTGRPTPPKPFRGPPGRRNGLGTTPARATRPAVSSGRALLRAASTLLFEEGGRMLFSLGLYISIAVVVEHAVFVDKRFFLWCDSGLQCFKVCGPGPVAGAGGHEQLSPVGCRCGQVASCAGNSTDLSTGLQGARGRPGGGWQNDGEGEALEEKAAAALWRRRPSEMACVTQLQVVLPGVGLFDAAVGTVLDAQLPFMLLRGTVVETDGQVRHKVEAGAHFLVACDKARAGVAGADAALEEPGLCPGVWPRRSAGLMPRTVLCTRPVKRRPRPTGWREVPMAPPGAAPPASVASRSRAASGPRSGAGVLRVGPACRYRLRVSCGSVWACGAKAVKARTGR